eukprot:TRINITY_DN26466_c0_g2_i1.p1 TRINITY_DN26466_c0_g2~~TRINITY_DN26466_c0_g2_i1.p1  ORF type:complete len:575 (+),score=217.36 TRINITY_DN26466_c0_g2_i1:88-1725(+)
MPPQGRDNTNTVLAASGVTVLVIFAAFYRYGGDQLQTEWRSKEDRLRENIEVTQRMIRSCQADMDSPEMQHVQQELGVGNIASEKRALEKRQHDLEQTTMRFTEQLKECRLSREAADLKWKSTQEETEKLIKAEKDRFAILNQHTKQLSDHTHNPRGMRAILLLSNLKRLSNETANLRKELGMPSVTMDEEYFGALVDKWNKKAPREMRVGESIRPISDKEVLKDYRPSLPYDPDRHAKYVFFQRKLSDGQYMLPGWNGRQGTQQLRYGTYVGSDYLPVSDVTKQMRVMYNYAMCAVGLNITKFMYPTLFKGCDTCHTEFLHNYIETPIVLFCRDCLPQGMTNEFQLLCRGYTDVNLYGTALFWRARSRLRFKAQFMLQAEKWFEESGTWANETTSLRIPRSEGFMKKKCDPGAKHGLTATLCYERLLKGNTELSTEAKTQCMPEWDSVYEYINKELKRGPHRTVYISTDCTSEEWIKLKDKVSDPERVVRRDPTGKQSEDTIVDTFISALAQKVVVNRFDVKSTMIAEAHMLQNALISKNIVIW